MSDRVQRISLEVDLEGDRGDALAWVQQLGQLAEQQGMGQNIEAARIVDIIELRDYKVPRTIGEIFGMEGNEVSVRDTVWIRTDPQTGEEFVVPGETPHADTGMRPPKGVKGLNP